MLVSDDHDAILLHADFCDNKCLAFVIRDSFQQSILHLLFNGIPAFTFVPCSISSVQLRISTEANKGLTKAKLSGPSWQSQPELTRLFQVGHGAAYGSFQLLKVTM